MTMIRKPGNTGWQPGHAPSTPRPPAAPPSGGGGPPGQGSAIVRQPADPKHIHHAVYRVGQPAPGRTNTQMEHPYVSHSDRRVDAGRRMAPAKAPKAGK
jgi:hypothetical protein